MPSVSRPVPASHPAAGATPTPTTTASQSIRSPLGELELLDPAVAVRRGDLGGEEHAAALVAVHLDEPAADVGAEDVGER